MAQYKTGLVCGKFYPPHLGHQYLIDTALAMCWNKVILFLVYKPGENPDMRLRQEWLTHMYPEDTDWDYEADDMTPKLHIIPVIDLETDDNDPQSSIGWAEYTEDILREWEFNRPDVIFSSEEYGSRWADALKMDHVLVDRSRTAYPISGTKVRENPLANWRYLPGPVRGHYALRVAVIGPESTGKTTLSNRLAEHFNTLWVPEYGRLYVENKGSVENTNQRVIFPMILQKQPEMEDRMAMSCNRLLICDTELITTKIWYELWQPDSKGDAIDRALVEEIKSRKYDLFLLSHPHGAPWVDDGIRDQGDTREWFVNRLYTLFDTYYPNTPMELLPGSWDNRFARAVEAINDKLKRYGEDQCVPLTEQDINKLDLSFEDREYHNTFRGI